MHKITLFYGGVNTPPHTPSSSSDSINVRWAKLQPFTSSFFAIMRAKNYENRLVFYGAIQKNKSGPVF